MSLRTKADFFVHPDYHRASLHRSAVEPEIATYEEVLVRRIGTSALPVLVYDPELGEARGEFWDLFDPEHRFPTRVGTGVLDPSPHVHTRFNRLMAERRVSGGFVHGSYLEACVLDFKTRLLREKGTLRAVPPSQRCIDANYSGPSSVKFGTTLSLDPTFSIASEFTSRKKALAPKHFAPDAETYFW